MKRRNLIKQFGKVSILTCASGLTASAVASVRSKADEKSQDLSRQVASLRKRVDAMEANQKKLVKTVCVVMACSTGIDLTLLV
jgi:hypothetical protein